MKVKEQKEQLREMKADELKDQADALKESLFRLKFRKRSVSATRWLTSAARKRRSHVFIPL